MGVYYGYMKKAIITLIVLIIIVAGVSAVIANNRKTQAPTETPATEETASITGCYVARLAKDVYTLNVQSEFEGKVTGTLTFKNFEKDSSSGTIMGMYNNDILDALYTFNSEGMESEMQVVFKKTPEGFVRGYGEMDTVENRVTFKDVNALEWDTKAVFKAEPCQ